MKKIKLTKKQIENIIQEEAIPVGLNITMGVHKQDGKENQDYYKEFGKKMDDYYKPLSDTEKENSDSVMKYSYDKDSDEYHNEYEILNGQEMLRYMNDPDERFKDRAEKAIAGSAEMGNNPEWANVVTADQAGFTGPDFGKQLVARIKSREEKYKEEDKLEKYDGMGDVAIPGAGKGEQRKLAIAENKYNSKNKKTMKRLNEGLTEKGLKYLSKLIKEKGPRDAGMKVIDMILSRELGGLGIYDLPDSVTLMNGLDSIEEAFDNGDLQGGFNIAKETAMEMIEDEGGMYMEENKKQKIKESKTMKRLRFKKPFNGVENALNLIPESYKVDNKTFQMTDGNENYEIRWEGSINEGKASILKASDKNLMNEDMQRMKELFNFKSQDTLGNLKGSERLNENKQFDAIWDKTKNINEMTGGFGFTGEGNLEGNTPMIDEEEKVEEAAKPDFPDLDGDGDTEEPMKKAAKDKKEKEESGIEEGEMHEEEKKGKVINILKQLPKDHKMSEKEKEAIEKALEIMKKMK